MHKHFTIDAPYGTLHVGAECTECGETFGFDTSKAAYDAWVAGAHIQNVMPHVSPSLRELLISGVCGECFDKIFAEVVEDSDEDEEAF